MAEPVEMGVGGGLNPTWYTHIVARIHFRNDGSKMCVCEREVCGLHRLPHVWRLTASNRLSFVSPSSLRFYLGRAAPRR